MGCRLGGRLSGGSGDDDVFPWCLLEINGDRMSVFISLRSRPREGCCRQGPNRIEVRQSEKMVS